ncbi:MAG: zinc ribbon domain-containing protein [Mycobacterium sp.]|nr:zinc ribbon domain-containing protein [Mycobacterium sp.]
MSALRLRSYVAAPREPVLLPALVSSLFPQLPERAHRTFRIGLAVVMAGLVGAAALRLPGVFVAMVAAGIPLLFVLYLGQLGYRGPAAVRLLVAAGLGTALGVGFALLSGAVVAQAYGVPLESGVAAVHLRTAEAAVSAVAAVAVWVPAIVIRILSAGPREALRGYTIGAAGGLFAACSSVAVRMLAQLDSGLVDRDQPLSDLLIEAGIRGVTVPVSAAAAGGVIGIALWFKADRRGGSAQWILLLIAVLPVGAHIWLGDEDAAGITQWAKVSWHIAFTGYSVLLLRLSLQLALLRESQDDADSDQSVLCTYCTNTVPDLAFCSICGVAMTGRRTPGRTLTTRRLLVTWTTVIAVLGAGLVGLSAVTAQPEARYLCPPNCGRPSMGKPVAVNPTFTAADGAYEVSYPASGTAYAVTTDDTGVTARFTGGSGGVMRLFGEPAHGRDARDIATTLLANAFPDSRVAYEIPNTLVGYHQGYGVAADDWPDGENVVASRTRILVMVAVKDDLALVAAAAGPYHEFGANSGPPTGASLELAQDMGKYVNSFRWRGDPLR